MDLPEAIDLLAHGEIEVAGRIIEASNATILARVTLDGREVDCVYKPVAGERPLRDFPPRTLAAREVAAYEVSRAAGFDVVPPTVLRDGPFGPGSVQLWVDDDEEGAGLVDVVVPDEVETGWLPVLRAFDMDGEPVVLVHADEPALRMLALFDAVTNNADRKAGHVLHGVLPGRAGRGVVGVDHGLTFHDEDKLRTVLWGWAGRDLPPEGEAALRRLAEQLDAGSGVTQRLASLLAPAETDALRVRVEQLITLRRFPEPVGDRPVIPWPPV